LSFFFPLSFLLLPSLPSSSFLTLTTMTYSNLHSLKLVTLLCAQPVQGIFVIRDKAVSRCFKEKGSHRLFELAMSFFVQYKETCQISKGTQ
jgi:hypothetical protein